MVVGQYHLVAMTLNSLGVEPETDDFPSRFPAMSRAADRCARLAKVLVVGAGHQASADPDAPMGNGRAIAVVAGRAGATVACADLDTDAARATADLVEAEGATAHVLTADVADPEAWRGRGRGGRRRDGRPRRAGVQRGHRRGHGHAGHHARAVGPGVLGERAVALPAGVGGAAGDARGRLDRVHQLGGGPHGRQPDPRLRRVEGRAHRALPSGRRRGRSQGHPRQRRRAGPHRHGARTARHRRADRRGRRHRSRSAGRAPRGRSPNRWCSCSATEPATSPASSSPWTAG